MKIPFPALHGSVCAFLREARSSRRRGGERRAGALALIWFTLAPALLALNPPVFGVPRGFYSGPFQLTLAVDAADAASPTLRVRYTLDGRAPSPTVGADYVAPLSVQTTSVVRAIVYDTADTTRFSASVTHSYFFPADVVAQPPDIPSATDARFAAYPSYPRETYDVGNNRTAVHDYAMDPDVVNNPAYAPLMTTALTAIPTVSVAVDVADMFGPTGFYDGEDQKPCSLEIIDPHHPSLNQQLNCGIESHSSNRLKRSLRVEFKSSYGASKLNSALLQQDAPLNTVTARASFDTLVLRAGNNRSWARAWNPDATTYTEDEWYRATHGAMTGVASHGTFVHLYINGLYWGLYNLVERPDESFAALYLGGKKGDHFSLKEDGRTKGDPARWNYLVGTLLSKDMTVPANYAELRDYLDVGLFSDYLILAWYAAINDWPNNNWWIENRNDQPTPARYFAWDGEWSWDRGNPYDPSIHGETPQGAWVHPAFRNGSTDASYQARFWRALKVNADFRMTFADHVYQHTAPGGALSDINSRLRWNALNLFVEDAVIAESARWGDAITPNAPRTRDVDWNREVGNLYALMGGNGARLIAALRTQNAYPTIDPPRFNRVGGLVAQGAAVALSNPNSSGTIYYRIDGDPRQPGGGLDATAQAYDHPLVIDAETTVRARIWDGAQWSALALATFTPTTSNHAPVVSAVGPIIATMPNPIALNATASDDGWPTGGLTTTWSLLSGPGTVAFDTPEAFDTTATFSAPGNYVLRFTASDGDLASIQDVPVFVYAPPAGGAMVRSFTLINADTGNPIAGFESLAEGAVLDYALLPTRRLNLRAETTPSSVGSVRFALNAAANFRTESELPYALAGDSNGRYNTWTPVVGRYTLKATPYAGANATGAVGAPLTVHFQVVDNTTPDATPPAPPTSLAADTVTDTSFVLRWSPATDDVAVTGYEVFRDGVSAGTSGTPSKSFAGLQPSTSYVMTVRARDAVGNWSVSSEPFTVTTAAAPPVPTVVSFTLINADTDQPVAGFEMIADGAVISRAALPTTHLNIGVNTNPTIVGSVRIGFDANASVRTESQAPYALFGDTAGDFNAGVIANGMHHITGTPYVQANAKGNVGAAKTVTFTIQQ